MKLINLIKTSTLLYCALAEKKRDHNVGVHMPRNQGGAFMGLPVYQPLSSNIGDITAGLAYGPAKQRAFEKHAERYGKPPEGMEENIDEKSDFPIYFGHVKRIAEALEPGQVVAFRPVNSEVKNLIIKHEQKSSSSSSQENDLLITGKGFLAGGKSSDLPFLAGRVPVDPRMSKLGTNVKNDTEILKMKKEYEESAGLYPQADIIMDPPALEASEEVKEKCTKQGRLIIMEGGPNEEPFTASSLSEGISFEKVPEENNQQEQGRERPKNSICQYIKNIHTESIKECQNSFLQKKEEKTFDQYHVFFTSLQRQVLLRNENDPDDIFKYDKSRNCFTPLNNSQQTVVFTKLQVFAYAFVTPGGSTLVYPQIVADYDILMFGLHENSKTYATNIKTWLDGFHNMRKESIPELRENIKRALKPESKSGFPLPHSLSWERDLEEKLVNTFRGPTSRKYTETESLAKKSGLPFFRMIRHNQESANYGYPNSWEYDKKHPIIWKDIDGTIKSCLPTGQAIRDESFLKNCELQQFTFFPHIFWTYKDEFKYQIPKWNGKLDTHTYNENEEHSLKASPFADDMLEKILEVYEEENKKRSAFGQDDNFGDERPLKKTKTQVVEPSKKRISG